MYMRQTLKIIIVIVYLIVLPACDGDPNIQVDGPASLLDTVPGQYTIVYTTGNPISRNQNFTFNVEANGTRVATAIPMLVPPGAGTASSTPFSLTCTLNGSVWTMTGPTGSTTGSSPFKVHGERILTGGNTDGEDKEISCTPSPVPLSARIINRGGNQDSIMIDAVPATYKVELTMSGNVTTPQTFVYKIEEDDWSWFGGDLLQTSVNVDVPVGSNIGYGSFTLTCIRNGSNWDLVGFSGIADNEAYFQLVGYGPASASFFNKVNTDDKNTDTPRLFHVVHCEAPAAGFGGTGVTTGGGTGVTTGGGTGVTTGGGTSGTTGGDSDGSSDNN